VQRSMVEVAVDGRGFTKAFDLALQHPSDVSVLHVQVDKQEPDTGAPIWKRIVQAVEPNGTVWRHLAKSPPTKPNETAQSRIQSMAMNRTTAADVMSVGMNKKGDFNTLLSALLIDSSTAIFLLVIFCVLRSEFDLVYSGNIKRAEAAGDDFPKAPRGWGPCSWICGALCTSIDDIDDHVGLDAALMIEFSHMAMKICATIGVPMCLLMGPAHWFFGGMPEEQMDPLSRFGMSNITVGNWLYWVHACLVWLVLLSAEFWIEKAMLSFLPRRKRWLKMMPPPRSTTVLIENIPPEECSDIRLREYFSKMFSPEQVKAVHVIRKTDELLAHVQSRQSTELSLKRAQARLQSSGRRPQHWDLVGGLVDSIEFYQREMDTVSQIIAEERARFQTAAKSSVPDPSIWATTGFVTFGARREAEIALRLQYRADAEQFVMSFPPHPLDVRWSDLRFDLAREKLRERFGYACIVGLYIGFMPITVAISSVTNLGTLRTHFAWLDRILVAQPLLENVLEGVMAEFALTLFASFLPTLIVMIIDNFFVLKANAWMQHRLQVWYFWFQIIFILLVTAVGNSILLAFETLVQSPLQVFGLLADCMPSASHFYLNFMMLQWVTHAMNLTRYINLFKFLALQPILGKEQAKVHSEPEDQDYYGFGSRSARWTTLLVIALVFCSLSPLVSLLAFVNFAVCRLVYGYLLVFAEERKPDTGGVFFAQQLEHLMKALFVYAALMVGVLLRRGPGYGPVYIAAGALLYHMRAYRKFHVWYCWENLPFEEIVDDESCDKRPSRASAYVQAELLDDSDGSLTARSLANP